MNTADPEFSVVGYAKRAKSALYRTPKDRQPLSTLDAFGEAHRRFPEAGFAWISRLNQVGQDNIREIVEGVPVDFMSPVEREFATRLLAENTVRLRGAVEKS